MSTSLRATLKSARACQLCADKLPHAPRPLLQASPQSRLVIIGQAPGAKAHHSGIPWDDRSGERLREWLGLPQNQFYNDRLVALLPMGLCFPGSSGRGDKPPRPECAPEWHDRVLSGLTRLELTLLVGKYAIDKYLGSTYDSLTVAVRDVGALLPARAALPHPSPRNNIWLARNPWFEDRTLKRVRARVAEITSRSTR